MSDWPIALISGVSALGGATVGSITQTRLFHTKLKHDSTDAARSRKRHVYESFLNLVMSLPEVIRDGTVAPFRESAGIEAVLKPMRLELNRLGVLLMLDGSDGVRKEVTIVRQTIVKVLEEEWNEEFMGVVAREKGVYEAFQDLFKEKILPSIVLLSQAMRADLVI